MDDDLETKQQYLRSEIIDQGYDPNEFSAFMANIRGEDGLNLDNWSFSDLQTVVNQFRAQYSNNQQQDTANQNEDQEEQKQNNYDNQEVKEEHVEGSKNAFEELFPNEPFPPPQPTRSLQ